MQVFECMEAECTDIVYPENGYIDNDYDMVAKSIGDDINYKQLLILPFDN